MDSSNISSSSSSPVCNDDEVVQVQNNNVIMPWPSNDFSSFRAFDSNTCLLCTGMAAALYTMFWLIRRYGPVLTKAKSPAHRKNESDRLITRIHDKWYDLSGFEHPGGPVALGLAKGRDATALLESHHFFIHRKKLLRILAKYEVSPDEATTLSTLLGGKRNDDSPYDWSDIETDGFASDLRELVVDHFESLAKDRGIGIVEATKATPKRWFVVCSFLGLFFASLPLFVQGRWAFIVVTPILAWLSITNYWHDSLHFALSSNWRINATLPYLLPLLSSPWMWYHHHNIGHHAYTNIAHRDPDLAHAPQLMREHESIKWRPSHLNQARFSNALFIWSIAHGIGLNLLNDVRATVKLSYNNVVSLEKPSMLGLAAHIGGRFIYVYVAFLWPFMVFPLFKAMIWATIPNAIFSLCFMVNTQINHLNDICGHASDTNFFKHQAITAQNFGNGNLFCYYFSGGLNYQIEHHLFPTINHCHLPALSAGVKRICKKHGVAYNHVSGYGEAISEHFAHTASMATKPH
mmetsp:Transcript_1123/g.2352  ORF Transcript_1123/g.2352 Transcript_1123/m.2352 type:complete len:519 (-) Transcript_1123:69-1625(-)|eukprot:CAMPEP_0172301858 /NCGR_PEP_ID=MMETSP1058-20130122/3673_1 /TAXON_ID=83371 /ORGANISM="Detonula confervacea, Strain CCMP 353" /LENGTH=518 /DNA_ID=CAMNT_0013012145 /DNA_START=82 /DNA_END=1638 /DNA_ORIENTATION=+